MKFNPYSHLLAAGMFVAACFSAGAQTDFPGATTDPAGWETVWSDHFNGTALDRDTWNVEVNGDGGGNNELQYYCEKGVSVRDGNLVLTATRENYGGRSFTSGRINSSKKLYFKHGKIEARIQLPVTYQGLWPAFWMLGNDFEENGWPYCGEIDILEMGHSNGYNGRSDRFFNGAMHWGPAGAHFYDAQDFTASESLQGEGNYHTFTCVWDETRVSMYLDGSDTPYYTYDVTPTRNPYNAGKYFHKPAFIIFNLAIGGDFPGITEPGGISAVPEKQPAEMLVDWVRVSQPVGNDNYTFMIDEEIQEEEVPLPESIPTPTHGNDKVISLFSNRYENNIDFGIGGWNQATQTSVVNVSNNFAYQLRYFNYLGLEFKADVSQCKYLHVDYWTTEQGSKLGINPISFNPTADGPEWWSDAMPASQWRGFDIPLESFNADMGELRQLRLDSSSSDFPGAYIANIYFWSEDAVVVPELPTPGYVPVPTRPESEVLSVFGSTYPSATGFGIGEWSQATTTEVIKIKNSDGSEHDVYYLTKFNYLGWEFDNDIDISDYDYLHVDYWTPDGRNIGVTPISRAGNANERPYNNSLTRAEWNSLDIDLINWIGLDFTQIFQMKFDGGDLDHGYIANVYFYKSERSERPAPDYVPVPQHPAGDVLSLFSSTYDAATGFNYNSWTSATYFEEVEIDSRKAAHLMFFQWFGWELWNNINVSGYDYMHVDYWTADGTSFSFTPIGNGEKGWNAMNVKQNQWNSYDVPLSYFSGVDLANVAQIKFAEGTSNEGYIANVYFYKGEGPDEEETGENAPNSVPTPIHDADKVFSFYSTYGDNVSCNFEAWDGKSRPTDTTIAGKHVYKVEDFTKFGWTNFRIDVSRYDHVHVDFWTPDEGKKFGFVPISVEPTVENPIWWTNENDSEIIPKEWNSYDVPLSYFTAGGIDFSKLGMMKFETDGVSVGYIANVYFYLSGEQGENPGGDGGDEEDDPKTDEPSEGVSYRLCGYIFPAEPTYREMKADGDIFSVTEVVHPQTFYIQKLEDGKVAETYGPGTNARDIIYIGDNNPYQGIIVGDDIPENDSRRTWIFSAVPFPVVDNATKPVSLKFKFNPATLELVVTVPVPYENHDDFDFVITTDAGDLYVKEPTTSGDYSLRAHNPYDGFVLQSDQEWRKSKTSVTSPITVEAYVVHQDAVSEFLTLTLLPDGTTTALRDVEMTTTALAEYYNLYGQRIAQPAPGQVVIRRQGSDVEKIAVR